MKTDKEKAKIVKYPGGKQLNIGIVIFGIIFLYLIVTIIMYLTAPKITVYEVRQGSILKDNAYTGLAIREEMVVYAENSGYANYYAENTSKVKVGTKIYTISDEKLKFQEVVSSDAKQSLSAEEKNILLLKIQSYHNQFKEHEFSSTYQLKNEIQNSLNKITSQSKSEQLEEMMTSGEYSDLIVKTAVKDGIVVYETDGLESVTTENITLEQLHKKNYKKTEFTSNRKISSDDAVYKIVTDDNWKLLMEITEETKEVLSDKSVVTVNFKKDNQEMKASISFPEQFDKNVLCLTFSSSMIRYVNERYLDVELILENETGLKIPKTAETSKEFYAVPKSYLTVGGNSSSDGVMRRQTNSKGESITEFLKVTVYYEENETVYLDPNVFEEGDILVKPDSMETYALNETRSLKGVYCINKGYAVFKQIRILCESDEYYIIEEGNSFGLSNFDHIALDSTNIKENDVVF